MAQARPRRKGWQTAFRLIGLVVAAAVVAFPVSFIGTTLMSPLLGRLEARYGIELVGHSGPSDWIYETVFGITTVLVLAFLLWIGKLASRPIPNADVSDIEAGRPE